MAADFAQYGFESVGSVRVFVFSRDGACLGPALGAPGECRDRWGDPVNPADRAALEMDYLGGRMRPGEKHLRHANPAELVTVCAAHHRGAGPTRQWSTSRVARAMLRRYVWARVCGLTFREALENARRAQEDYE